MSESVILGRLELQTLTNLIERVLKYDFAEESSINSSVCSLKDLNPDYPCMTITEFFNIPKGKINPKVSNQFYNIFDVFKIRVCNIYNDGPKMSLFRKDVHIMVALYSIIFNGSNDAKINIHDITIHYECNYSGTIPNTFQIIIDALETKELYCQAFKHGSRIRKEIKKRKQEKEQKEQNENDEREQTIMKQILKMEQQRKIRSQMKNIANNFRKVVNFFSLDQYQKFKIDRAIHFFNSDQYQKLENV